MVMPAQAGIQMPFWQKRQTGFLVKAGLPPPKNGRENAKTSGE